MTERAERLGSYLQNLGWCVFDVYEPKARCEQCNHEAVSSLGKFCSKCGGAMNLISVDEAKNTTLREIEDAITFALAADEPPRVHQFRPKVVNLFGGPGTGKSTMAAGLFSALKFQKVNCEYIQEYAKDKAWEHGKTDETPLVMRAQEYLFGKQHFRMRRCAQSVELMITDSPLLLGLIYTPDDFELPSLRNCIKEAHHMYDSLNVFITRKKEYNPAGRFQTEDEAVAIDAQIKQMLKENGIPFIEVPGTEDGLLTLVSLANSHLKATIELPTAY